MILMKASTKVEKTKGALRAEVKGAAVAKKAEEGSQVVTKVEEKVRKAPKVQKAQGRVKGSSEALPNPFYGHMRVAA